MKDAKGHGSNTRGGMPLKGHDFHTKSNEQLRFIAKDAGEAAKAMQGHSPQSENKYLDQVNDASTVLGFRQRGGVDLSQPAHQTGVRAVPNNATNENGHVYGSPEAIKDFTDKYGGPRDHAAEQRGFNRGAREINNLKRQGK